MPPQLDHLILNVNDRAKSVEFYTRVLDFAYEGEREGTPFSVIRVTPSFILQLAPFGTKGGEHLAFAMSRSEFEQIFQRVRDGAIEYGDSFDTVGNGRGPGCCAVALIDAAARVALASIPAPAWRRVITRYPFWLARLWRGWCFCFTSTLAARGGAALI